MSLILWECPFARNVWALAKGRIQKFSNTATDFFLLFQYMVDKLDMQQLEVWFVIGWALWNARNKYHFEHIQLHPKVIFDQFLSAAQQKPP